MAGPLAIRCATESAERAEPIMGTASRVRRWLLVEQPGAWGADVPEDSRMDEDLALTLRSRAKRAGVRVLLIRRPGWRSPSGGPTRVYLAHTGRDDRWIEQLDLDDRAELARLDLDALASPVAPGVGVPGPESVHLVCTNGRHDPCCADLGRPVARALDEAATPEVWESSHVGGDRFAANVVALPSGVYLGRVPPERAEALLADLARGLVDLDCYRGRSCFPPLVQAAEILLRRELDERRLDAIQLVSTAEGDDGSLAVSFTHGEASAEVVVRRERGEAVRLTCHANGEAQPWRYRLVELTAGR